MKIKLLATAVICFGFTLAANANVYSVINNANTGPGTLRQAITDANSHNGADSIKFNMSDTSVAGRTITLSSALPSITGQLIIDGTSQNKGHAFGISYSKIIITASGGITQCFNVNASNCEIYGFFIIGFQTGIQVNSSYVQIGGINHGNVIYSSSVDGITIQNTDHAAIVGNLIGLDTAEHTNPGNTGDGIYISHSYAVSVGGHTSSASNVISGNTNGVKLDNSQYCDFTGNFIGTSGDGLTAKPNSSYGFKSSGQTSDIQIGGDSVNQKNVISGNALAGIYGSYSTSTFSGNYIGTDVSGILPLGNGTYGISLKIGSSDNLIGGDIVSAGNIIAFNGQEAIYFEASTCINNAVRRNSTFCNSQTLGNGGFKFNNGNNHIDPPQIVIANGNGVSGITVPFGSVDIFQDDSCSFCEGKTYIGSATADANGVFIVTGLLSGMVTATVTDTAGNTSEYSECTSTDNTACIVADFTTVPSGICINTNVTFTDQTVTKPGTSVSSWQWNFGDGNTSSISSPVHSYGTNGTYTVTLIAKNDFNCSDTIIKIIDVTGLPVAEFSSPLQGCMGSPVSFNDQSSAGAGAIITAWSWNFGDGGTSGIQNPDHTFDSLGSFTVTLTVTNSNGCISTITHSVNILPAPVASFTLLQQFGLQVTFTNTSSSNGGVSYLWDFGDGVLSNAENPVHLYSSLSVYTVCLTVFDSICNSSDSTCQVIDLPDAIVSSAASSIIITPNPVSDILFISSSSIFHSGTISLYDLAGRKILEQNVASASSTYTLNVQSVTDGMYILEVKSDAEVLSRKVNVLH